MAKSLKELNTALVQTQIQIEERGKTVKSLKELNTALKNIQAQIAEVRESRESKIRTDPRFKDLQKEYKALSKGVKHISAVDPTDTILKHITIGYRLYWESGITADADFDRKFTIPSCIKGSVISRLLSVLVGERGTNYLFEDIKHEEYLDNLKAFNQRIADFCAVCNGFDKEYGLQKYEFFQKYLEDK